MAALPARVLPELDRASAVVGLFETGTTECGRRISYNRAMAPSIGCFGLSIPGWLEPVMAGLGGDDAELAARYRQEPGLRRGRELSEALERLAATPKFWIKVQERSLATYAEAADLAGQLGLRSEHGLLLIFDTLVRSGPGLVRRLVQTSGGPPGEGRSEAELIRDIGEQIKATGRPAFAAMQVATRVDTIVSGKGTVRGISFDLAALGIPDPSSSASWSSGARTWRC